MAAVIYRGSTPTITFRPTNGMKVSDLGTPKVAIVQNLVYIEPETVTVDGASNSISVKLTEEDTLRLVPGVETNAQQVWKTEAGDIVRFPVHKLTVAETLMQEFGE